MIKTSVEVQVEYFDGHDEGDEGLPYYVASCDDLHFVTDGGTFEELLANIRESLELALHETDSIAEYNVSPDAKAVIKMDLPEYA